MIRYRGLTQFNVDNFVEEVLVKEVQWLSGSPEAIRGSYVFVCAHGSRDKRCGVCGPALITRFKEEIEGQGLDGQVSVSACSHVGGHKYAGNVIIFSSDAKGEVTGHWYGYVAPDDVPVLLHKHIGQGEIVDRLWRGQLGMSEEEQLKALVCSREHGLGSVMQGKFLIPPNFNGAAALNHFAIHGFRTAGQLKDAVNKTKTWLSTKMAAGLLTNGSIFAIEPMGICDEKYQENGAVCLIRNEGVSEIHPTGHLYTTKTGGTALEDRKPETVLLGELFITRCDFGGNRWTLRKFSVEEDDTFVVLQWRRRATDDEFGLKKPIQSSKKIVQHEDGSGIVNSIAMVEEMEDLSNHDKAKAIIILKAEENQIILSSIKSKELRMSWLQEEIKNQERVWGKSATGSGP